jgi:hypothetical protein
MRFLANENFPGAAVLALRASGHDVTWIRTDAPGSKDEDVLAMAVRENRILITFDKDFGELAWRMGLPATSGVILFRIPMPAPAGAGMKLAARIEERDDWPGHFTVIEPWRIRMRKLIR